MKHEIFVYNKTQKRAPGKFIKSVILRALNFLKLKQPVGVAVLIVNKREIERLNKIWRRKAETPDELSFGLNSRQNGIFANNNNTVLELGEIVLSAEKISDKKNLSKLLTHSLLHLLGHSHRQMERMEAKIFQHLDI